MTKLKNPILSLGAKGSLGKAISFRESRGQKIAEKIPIPGYRRTLPQLYQRWLYEDYAYLWTKQSVATKAEYRAIGSIYHLTGFQYWMKYNLKALPDIAGMWHFDYIKGGLTPDSSRNANTGTVVGPSPAGGIIDGGFFYDGLNDRVDVANSSSLQITGDLTIEAFGTVLSWKVQNDIVYKSHLWEYEFLAISALGDDYMFFRHGDGASEGLATPAISISLNDRHHFAVVRTAAPKEIHFYLDGAFINTAAYAKTPLTSNFQVRLGFRGGTTLWHGIQDHVVIYNRAEDATEIKRHSLRRYP